MRNVQILGCDVVGGARLHTGQPLHLRVGLRTHDPVAAGVVLEIHKLNGELLVRTDPDDDRSRVEIPSGESVVTVDVDSFDVLDGAYQVNVGIVGPHGTAIYDWQECAASIEVTYEGRASGTLAIRPTVAVEPRP